MVTHQQTTCFESAAVAVKHHVLTSGERLRIQTPYPDIKAVRYVYLIAITAELSINGQQKQPGQQIVLSPADLLREQSSIENTGKLAAEYLELTWFTTAEKTQALANVTEVRPWGSFTVLIDQPHFKLKQLWVTPGHRLSLQRHQKREEHWFITAGQPEITLNDKILHPTVSDYIHIPCQAWHRLANPEPTEGKGGTMDGVEMIELQLGTYFGEDDIERQSDDYGRQ